MKTTLRDMLFVDVHPQGGARHIGLELECFTSSGELINQLPLEDSFGTYYATPTRARMARWLLKSPLRNAVRIKGDGSIGADGVGEEGFELAILIREDKLYSTLLEINKFLTKFGARVNSTCGMHVHLDMRGRNWRKSARKLIAAQGLLFSLVPSRRAFSSYCREVKRCGKELDNHHAAISKSRHFETLEVRMHHGTTSIKEMYGWISLLLQIINSDKLLPKGARMAEASTILNLPEPLTRYMRKAFVKHGGKL